MRNGSVTKRWEPSGQNQGQHVHCKMNDLNLSKSVIAQRPIIRSPIERALSLGRHPAP